MESSNQKLEVIQDYDKLINEVDMDINECLEKYNPCHVLGQINCFQVKNRDFKVNPCFKMNYFDSCKSSHENQNQWSESTKFVDYLTKIRSRTIEELKNAQEESLEKFILDDIEQEKNVEMKNETSANKFYYQIRITNQWIFNVYTFATDFYMTPSDITLLE